jgi:hypothetical protein
MARTPEDVLKEKRSYTGQFLKPMLGEKYVPVAKKQKGGESVSEAAE